MNIPSVISANSPEFTSFFQKSEPLKIKFGIDPTSPDIHLGHFVVINKLKQLQEWGHQINIIIGDFTAAIGDPTGRSTTRPVLSNEEINENAKTYLDQIFLVLDKKKTICTHNSFFYKDVKFNSVIKLLGLTTLQQILHREDFKNRLENGTEIRLHELIYPLIQGQDSVMIGADVEIGGTDQLFNMMVGRDLQEKCQKKPQIVVTIPILEGLDGTRKMSKSYNNYIGISENPEEIFGKTMSISDETMVIWYDKLFSETIDKNDNPFKLKQNLAEKITALFKGEEVAQKARESWLNKFSRKNIENVDLPIVEWDTSLTFVDNIVSIFKKRFNIEKSKSEVRRLMNQGSIKINNRAVHLDNTLFNEDVLKLDKTKFVRIWLTN